MKHYRWRYETKVEDYVRVGRNKFIYCDPNILYRESSYDGFLPIVFTKDLPSHLQELSQEVISNV
jgi:hypothetical protein